MMGNKLHVLEMRHEDFFIRVFFLNLRTKNEAKR